MNTPEVAIDFEKTCNYRFAHRDIDGIDLGGRRECPACIEMEEGETQND